MNDGGHWPPGFWPLVTRFGEAQILLPACAAALLWLLFVRAAPAGMRQHVHPGRAAAWRWGAGLCLATALTTASKLAFLGWGLGIAMLDFTGFSGHSMFAAAVLPVLAAVVGGRVGALAGAVLALLVMVSRVHVGAHSWSEALSGAALGSLAAAWALGAWLRPPGGARAPLWLPLALAAWLTLLPRHAPPPRTHDLVVRLALRLSGHAAPHTRHQMLAEAGLLHPAPAPAPPHRP